MYEHVGAEIVMNLINDEKALNVLDIGSGFGFWGYMLKAQMDHEPTVTGVEKNPQCYERLERLGLYDVLYLGDATTIPDRPYWKNRDYDLAILSHVVEHMEKEKANTLLLYLKRLCDQIIVICPEGDTLCDHETPEFAHISTWTTEDFKKLGMNVRQVAYSHIAGRVVSFFERFYFKLKGLPRGGVLVAWWERGINRKKRAI